MEIECKQCGKIAAVPQNGRKYCSLECAGIANRKQMELTCINCKERFLLVKYRADKEPKYCCKKCYYEYKKKHIDNKIILVCSWCGKEFKEYPSNKRKFCQRECYDEWQRIHKAGENASGWKGGIKKYNCDVCGSIFEGYESEERRGRNKVCSFSCSGKRRSEMCSMENHSNWKGGISFEQYPKEWTDDLKESIRKRDNHICEMCGTHQDELNNGRVKKLDVHHIDYNKDNLNPKNLISLCRKCHLKTNYNRDYWLNYFNKEL